VEAPLLLPFPCPVKHLLFHRAGLSWLSNSPNQAKRKQGKGSKFLFVEGVPSTPPLFRQEAAVHWMPRGKWPPPHKCRFLSSRCQRLGRGTPGGDWEGVFPSQESFFQPFPCPVKWVSISQGLPLLCLRAPNEAENRQALWNQYDSTGQVEGLKERSRMEGSPSTPPPCLSPEKPTLVRSGSLPGPLPP
jgi:hypothetical protein